MRGLETFSMTTEKTRSRQYQQGCNCRTFDTVCGVRRPACGLLLRFTPNTYHGEMRYKSFCGSERFHESVSESPLDVTVVACLLHFHSARYVLTFCPASKINFHYQREEKQSSSRCERRCSHLQAQVTHPGTFTKGHPVRAVKRAPWIRVDGTTNFAIPKYSSFSARSSDSKCRRKLARETFRYGLFPSI